MGGGASRSRNAAAGSSSADSASAGDGSNEADGAAADGAARAADHTDACGDMGSDDDSATAGQPRREARPTPVGAEHHEAIVSMHVVPADSIRAVAARRVMLDSALVN